MALTEEEIQARLVEKERGRTMEKQAERSICSRCGCRPGVAFGQDGVHSFRCECYPEPPRLIKKPSSEMRRLGDMTSHALARAEEGHGSRALVLRDIKQYLAPLAKDDEVEIFIRFCRHYDMNPFVGECYLIPFGTGENRKHQIVVGIGFFVKRADKHPLYRGMNSGVMVQNGKEIIRRDGEFLFPGDTLVGGWCQVFVEARQPYVHTVTLSRWKKTTPGPWQNIPEHMIIKVAESQALRRAVPGTGPDAEYDLPIVVEAEADGPLPAFPETTAANVVVGTVADGPEVPAVEVPPEAFMGYCPDHGAAFNQKHGTTKAGKPYNFYSCSVKGPDGWCKKTPEDWLTGELEKVAPGLIEKGKIRERISEYLGVPWAELAPLGYVCIVQQIHEYKESLAQTTAAEPVAEAQPEPEAVVEF